MGHIWVCCKRLLRYNKLKQIFFSPDDVDECASSPCVNGACTNEVNGYTCQCVDGWQGTNCDGKLLLPNKEDCIASLFIVIIILVFRLDCAKSNVVISSLTPVISFLFQVIIAVFHP